MDTVFHAAAADERRSAELDGLRGLAILLVLIWHYVSSQLGPYSGSMGMQIKHIFGLAWTGVDLFFVLSGFLLSTILMRNREQPGTLKVFYIRRALRIIPLYTLLLVAYQVVRHAWLEPMNSGHQWLYANAMPFWSYATFTQNIFMASGNTSGAHFLGITWSLAVEEQFYLLLPLFILVLRPAWFPWVAVGCILSAPLIRFWLYGAGVDAFVCSIARLDALMLGALAAWAVRHTPPGTRWLRTDKLWSLLWMMFGGMTLMTWMPGVLGVFNHLWAGAFYATLLLLAVQQHQQAWLARFLRSRVLVRLGLISYGVYLSHQAISGLMHSYFMGRFPAITGLESAAVTCAALVLTLVVSLVAHHFVERPAIQYGRRWRYASA